MLAALPQLPAAQQDFTRGNVAGLTNEMQNNPLAYVDGRNER